MHKEIIFLIFHKDLKKKHLLMNQNLISISLPKKYRIKKNKWV
jgi:hypothetical protein